MAKLNHKFVRILDLMTGDPEQETDSYHYVDWCQECGAVQTTYVGGNGHSSRSLKIPDHETTCPEKED